MFWQIIFKSLLIRIRRVSIIFLALLVGSSIICAMSGIYFDISNKMSKELRTYGANFYVGSKDGSLINVETLDVIQQQAKAGFILAASPFLYGTVHSDAEKIVIMGMHLSQQRSLMPYWQINGSSIGVDFDQRNVLLGKDLAERLELSLGDDIGLLVDDKLKKFHIKGIIEAGDVTDNMLIVNLSLAQQLLAESNLATNFLLSVNNDNNQADQLAITLNQQFPDFEIKAIRKISHTEGIVLDKIKTLMGLVSLIVLVLVTLCVNTTLIAIIMERAKEFALQKSLGAKKIDIIKQLFAEIFIITAVACSLGIILGYIIAQILGKTVFNSLIDLRLPVLPLTYMITFIVATIAISLAVRRALTIDPAIILRGE